MDVQEINNQALTLVDQLKTAKAITSPEDYLHCGKLWQAGRDMMKAIDEGYDSLISSLHKAHKDAVAKKKSYYDPVETATKGVKQIMSAWDQEQERIRQAEQNRLAEIARKAEEERMLAEAITLEESMKASGATKEEAEQVSQTILSEPVYVPPISIPKAVPKMTGGPVYKTIWKAEVVDIMALVRAVASGQIPPVAILPNDVFLGQQARSLKEAMRIPGVRAYSERC